MEALPEGPAFDRSTVRLMVANALAKVRAMGTEPRIEAVLLYESYADGDLSPTQLTNALANLAGIKRQRGYPDLWLPLQKRTCFLEGCHSGVRRTPSPSFGPIGLYRPRC
jgi:hypothetical protein